MEKAILSKSSYIKGEQCLKYLYLYKKRYFLRDKMPPERVAVFTRGTNVGIIAQEIFPGGIDCKSGGPRQYAKAIAKTQLAIENGETVLYEAAFLSNNTLIYLDILVKKADGWHAYEVKSSLKISDTYLKDAALQNYIIKKSGLNIESFNLIYVNEDYNFLYEIDYNLLFKIQDVTLEVNSKYDIIKENIDNQLETLTKDHSPKVEIGLHCRTPYDCDFIGHCWKTVKEPSIFKVPSLSFEEQFEIYNSTNNISEININNDALSPINISQINALSLNEKLINQKYINKIFENQNEYSLLKVLSSRPAIPIFNNTKPYQIILYGFSLKTFDQNWNLISDSSFISNSYDNPSEEIIEKIKKITENKNLILSFEENKEVIEKLDTTNLYNIMDVFRNGYYYTPEIIDYRFTTLFKSLTGKTPWFNKIIIDRQAGLAYEKLFESDFTDIESNNQITTYLKEWMNYFTKMTQILQKI